MEKSSNFDTKSVLTAEGKKSRPFITKISSARDAEFGPQISKNKRMSSSMVIEKMQPYACLLTINFARPYSDRFLIDSMNRLVTQLNGELFGNRFSKRKTCLAGICVAEVCREGGRLEGCLHFHFLIKPCELFGVKNAQKVLGPIIRRLLLKFIDDKGRRITKVQGKNKLIDISRYRGLGSLPGYLTKEYEHRGAEADDLFGFLSYMGTGILGVSNRKKRDLVRSVVRY